jgi:transcriptional regulator with XRE-family HTH domain
MTLNPGVSRRQLRLLLRQFREAKDLTQREAAKAMEWSPSKLIRIESGQVRISVTDLRALLNHYEVIDPERQNHLLDLCRSARERSPYGRFQDVASKELLTFLEYELTATVVRNFEPILVPGLLQTEAYTRAVLAVIRGDKRPEVIEQQVDLRAERKFRILRSDPAPELHFLLDEGVIRRHVGGQGVMREQLEHLIEQCDNDAVSLRVVPFSHGMYRSLRVPFVVFEFDGNEDDDVLYIENADGEQLLRDIQSPDVDVEADEPDVIEPTVPATYLEIFLELEDKTNKDTTRQLLQEALRHLE